MNYITNSPIDYRRGFMPLFCYNLKIKHLQRKLLKTNNLREFEPLESFVKY